MRMTLMGEIAGESFELIWDDGALRGTPRLVERLAEVHAQCGEDAVAFITQVERAIGSRPHLVVWPEPSAGSDPTN